MKMRFEARELKQSAEPVKAAKLLEDQVYFSVSYADEERLIPILDAYLFAGRNLFPNASGQLYFQGLDPVRRDIPRENSNDFGGYRVESEESTHLFEFEQALEELMVCSLRRRGMLDPLSTGPAALTGGSLGFEARELKRFADPIGGADLKEGTAYFSVYFLDDESLIPGLEPHVFIGRDIEDWEPGLFFQDIDSYSRGVRHNTASADHPVALAVDSDDDLGHYEYEQALEDLMVCSLQRRRAGVS